MDRNRKQLILQVAALLAACLLVIIGGRILTGNRFEMCIPLGYNSTVPEADRIRIEWENGKEIPVREIAVRNGRDILIILQPEEAGDYVMNVMDQEEKRLFYDELHVSPLGTAYSMQTRNFTGDNALIAGITLLFAGLAVICIMNFIRMRGPMLCSYDAIWNCGACPAGSSL